MSKFQDLLLTEVDDIEALPLLHTCDAYSLRSILENMKLIPQMCDVFESNLLYTYYGLPSYRSNYSKATTNPAYYTICLILDSNKFKKFHKIYPFDSGAFIKLPQMKDSFFHHKSEIIDFELLNEIDSAKKVVKTFYQSNENYISEKPQLTKQFSHFDFEAIHYNNLINDKTNSSIDDRASSIEIIFNEEIILDRETVKQIIIPNCFKDDSKIISLIQENFDIKEPLGYNIFKGMPKEYFGLIRNEYLKFINN